MRVPLQMASESYQAATPIAAIQRVVNLYPEANPEGSEFPFTLLSVPGLKAFATIGTGPIRGMIAMGSLLFVVSGDSLYFADRFGTSTLVGVVGGNGAVRMTTNGTHVVVCTSLNAYAATTSSIVVLPEQGLCGAAYQDGYGIYVQAGTQKLWISGLDDLTTIGALDFTSADVSYDNVVGVISDHREVAVFKEHTAEFFYNSGDATFPFARNPSGFMERGCACAGSIAKADNRIFWLGDDLSVYQTVGYQPQKVSTPAIDVLINGLASPRTCEAFTYQTNGHTFYSLVFSDRCIEYDLASGKWHERESYGCNGRWRVSCHASIWGKNIVGDYSTGEVYELDESTYTEDGDPLIRSTVSPCVHAAGSRASMADVVARFEPGVGLVAGQGSSPMASLSWTDDEGHTWSNELWYGIGSAGQYGYETRWNRLGSFARRHLKLSVSDPVRVSIAGIYANVEARQ